MLRERKLRKTDVDMRKKPKTLTQPSQALEEVPQWPEVQAVSVQHQLPLVAENNMVLSTSEQPLIDFQYLFSHQYRKQVSLNS